MKKKPQLDDIDVVFDPKPLTKEEQRQISEYIQKDKARKKKKHYAQHGIGASGASLRK